MKKIGMVMAVVAVIALTGSSARAVGMDFDGRSGEYPRPVPFTVNEIEQGVPSVPVPLVVIEEPGIQSVDLMSGEELKGASGRLDASILSAIDHCDKNRLYSLRNNFAELLAYGTLQDKYAFVNNESGKYFFQSRAASGPANMDALVTGHQKGGIPVCMSWGTQNVCVKRETKEKICTAATLSCVVVTAGGSPVCTTVAAVCAFYTVWVDECNDVPYCTQWYTEVI